jgi:hypothetical protein
MITGGLVLGGLAVHFVLVVAFAASPVKLVSSTVLSFVWADFFLTTSVHVGIFVSLATTIVYATYLPPWLLMLLDPIIDTLHFGHFFSNRFQLLSNAHD